MNGRSTARPALVTILGIGLASGSATAHVGGLGGSTGTGSVPSWLTILTGGVIIGASFLFTSLMTDHDAIRAVNGWRLSLPVPAAVRAVLVRGAGATAVLTLVAVVASGLLGPRTPTSNAAILVVWAGWWAGYTMSVYLLGNTWPVLNPWRALARAVPRIDRRPYPARWGAWPSILGLLGLVWIEVISPVAERPGLLVVLILAYTAVTLTGAAVYGADAWFEFVDPVSRVFRFYGRIAPIQRTDDGIEFRLPTAALADRGPTDVPGETAFVIALLWATTYDGLVSTPSWAAVIRPVVSAGVPPLLVYFVTIVAGFALFYSVYRAASRKARDTADTYVTARFIERWFAPSLLPIAAGYHLAHFLGYFLSLTPALAMAVGDPLSPGAAQILILPGWFGGLQLLFVLVGHLLAVWVAHATSFDLFPGVLRPIRSQYPFIVVMIFYTMTSMWVIAQPFGAPPYV